MNHEKQNRILRFWFGDDPLFPLANQNLWFTKDPNADALIRERFEPLLLEAETGAFDDWPKTRDGALALVVLCDQLPRNAFRGEMRAFSFDERALKAAQIAIAHGFDGTMSAIERCFLYLPFEHSERMEDQNRAIELFRGLVREAQDEEKKFISLALDYAVRHHDIIEKFGRFPHRNEILGRESTREERNFLKTPGAFF